MTPVRLIAIGFIFFCTTIAWMILGATVTERSGEADGSLRYQVQQLWGGEHAQGAPTATLIATDVEKTIVDKRDTAGNVLVSHQAIVREPLAQPMPLGLTMSEIKTDLDLEHRRKGLLWFPTYAVEFGARYRFVNDTGKLGDVEVTFPFPSREGIYDSFKFVVDGREATAVTDLSKGATMRMELKPGQIIDVAVGYKSRGIGTWRYSFGNGVSQVKDFSLALTTNVDQIDFPVGSMSPSTNGGKTLAWNFENLVTGQFIAVELPSRLNPGPVAARISFFAPVSLLFFFTVMVIVGVVKQRNLHPMNYFFLAAGFFAFHLLLAYLVDIMDIFAAFGVSAAASVFLVVSYLRIVMGQRAAWLQAAAAQLIFLVGFSCAFFYEGKSGLSVAVGATATLFVLMQLTAKVKWNDVFGNGGPPSGPPSAGTSGAPVGLPR